MRLRDLTGRHVALVGFGIDVRAAVPALTAAGPASLRVLVEDPSEYPDTSLPVGSLADDGHGVDVFVRSPGVPRSHPTLVAAESNGARITTPVALWLHDAASEDPPRQVVVVTGTKGKSTTTLLLSRLAARAGTRIPYAGNIGVPVYQEGWDSGTGPAVIEVSSYQAADIESVPTIGVLTALAPDHVDWHGGVDRYVEDKLRAFTGGGAGRPGVLLVPAGDAFALQATAFLEPRPVPLDPSWPAQAPDVPTHVLSNAALAAEAVDELTGHRPDLSDVLAVLAEGLGLPARLETVASAGGIRWIDDALASNPTATAAALRWLRGHSVTLLLGGQARDVPLDPLADEIGRWLPGDLRVIALRETGGDMADALGLTPTAGPVEMEEAVLVASEVTPSGGIVLFSPAAPTPKGEGTWRDRSQRFRAALATGV